MASSGPTEAAAAPAPPDGTTIAASTRPPPAAAAAAPAGCVLEPRNTVTATASKVLTNMDMNCIDGQDDDPFWHDRASCAHDIVCGRDVPHDGEKLTSTDALAPVRSWLEFVRKITSKAEASRDKSAELSDEVRGLFPPDDSMLKALRTGISITKETGLLSDSDVKSVMQKNEPLALWFCNHNIVLLFMPSEGPTSMSHVSAYQMQIDNDAVMTEAKPTAWAPAARALTNCKWLKCSEFARQIATLSGFMPPDCIPKTTKDGKEYDEERETVSPKYFTEWLLPTLDAASAQLHQGIDDVGVSVLKSMHDTVLWKDARIPWRRSPTYVGLKAMLHVHATEKYGDKRGRVRYKLQRMLYLLFVWKKIGTKLLTHVKNHGLASAFLTKLDRRLTKLQSDANAEGMFPTLLRGCRYDLTSAYKQANEVWNTMSSVPQMLPSVDPSLLDDTRLIEQHQLGDDIDRHTTKLQSLLESCTSSTCEPTQRDDELSGELDGNVNTFISTANYVFTSILNGELPFENSSVESISERIEKIHDDVQALGEETPLIHSQEILVALALFRTIDTKVGKDHQHVNKFDPEIDIGVLSTLLLPSNRLLETANILETWYQQRIEGTRPVYRPSTKERKGFGFQEEFLKDPRYRDPVDRFVSTVLQCEERDISAKYLAVKELKEEYTELTRKRGNMECTFYSETDHWGYIRHKHCWSCRRCSISETLQGNKFTAVPPICRFLPSEELERTVIGFEMTQPIDVLMWRHSAAYISGTMLLGLDLDLAPQYSWDSELRKRLIPKHECVRDLMISVPKLVCRQVQLGSDTEWTEAFHGSSNKLHCTEDLSEFVLPVGGHVDFKVSFNNEVYQQRRFSLKSESPYFALDTCLEVTTEKKCNQNVAIAAQSQCPPSLGLAEFISFGSIRSGCLLQHRQLLHAVVQGSLNFSHKDVLVLFAQTLWETLEPNGSWFRKTGTLSFAKIDFVNVALEAATLLAEASKEQWEHPWAVATTAILVSRCLVPGNTEEITSSNQRALLLLRECRGYVLDWYHKQLKRLRMDAASGRLQSLADRQKILYNVGFVGLLTFLPILEDTAMRHGPPNGDAPCHKLIASDEDVLDFVLLSGAFHDNTPAEKQRDVPHMEPLVSMILCAALPHIRRHLFSSTTSLTKFAQKHTNLVQEHREWATLDPKSVWYHIFVPSNMGEGMVIEVDILHGSILVNGASVTSLPPTVRRDPSFRELFGSRSPLIEELGSSQYATLPVRDAPTFYFTACDTGKIVIQMKPTPRSKEKYLLVDHTVLSGIPTPLRVLYSQWRCEDHVVFLPRAYSEEERKTFANPLVESPYIFNFKFGPNSVPVLKAKDINGKLAFLSALHHPLTNFCLTSLARVDDPNFIFVWWQPKESEYIRDSMFSASGSVLAHADRVQLCFTVKRGGDAVQIHADFSPGLVVGQNQNFGTLSGLSHGLLLEEIGGRRRSLVMPLWMDGHKRTNGLGLEPIIDSVTLLESESDEVRRSETRISAFVYQLHYHLRQLIAPPDTTANIYLAYLHAITSGVPIQLDPWTECTGSEAAMTLLQSPRTCRHEPFSIESLTLLKQIRSLSPSRHWYPKHLKRMEYVKWPNLPKECALDSYAVVVEKLAADNYDLNALFTETQVVQPKWEEWTGDTRMSAHCPGLTTRAGLLHSRHIGSLCILPQHNFDTTCARAPAEPFARAEVSSWCRVPSTFERGSAPAPIDPNAVYDNLFVNNEDIFECKVWEGRCAQWYRVDEEWVQCNIKSDILTLILRICSAETKEDNLFLLSALAWRREKAIDDAPFHVLLALVNASSSDKERISSATAGKTAAQLGRSVDEIVDAVVSAAEAHRKEFSYHQSPPDENTFPASEHGRLRFLSATQKYNKEKAARRLAFTTDQKCQQERLKHTVRLFLEQKLVDEVHKDPVHGSTPWDIRREVRQSIEEAHFKVEELETRSSDEVHRKQRAEVVRQFILFCSNTAHITYCRNPETRWVEPKRCELRPCVPTSYDDCLDRMRHQVKSVRWTEPKSLPCAPWEKFAVDREVDKFIPPELLFDKGDELSRKLDSQMEGSFTAIVPDRVCEMSQETERMILKNATKYLTAVSLATGSMWQLVQRSFSGKSIRPNQRIERKNPFLLLSNLLNNCQRAAIPMSGACIEFSSEGKKQIIELVRLWTLEQKATRVLQYLRSGNTIWLTKELVNPPHQGWDPTSELGFLWLCLELENNMSIWPRQHDVCMKMLQAEDQDLQHRIVQLNMGEGKTSVILPMLTAALSDGDNLCRVVVPSALHRGTADGLARTLGGLLQRQIWTIPCRRDVQFDDELATKLLKHYERCQKRGAIIVTSPESILSFQLKFIEFGVKSTHDVPIGVGADGDTGRAKLLQVVSKLQQIQKFLLENSREVLDEADSLLHYKRQLVYTMGTQEPPSGGNQRHKVIMSAMTAVFELAKEAENIFGQDTFELSPIDANLHVPRLLNASPKREEAWQWFRKKLGDRLLGKDGCSALMCPLFGAQQRAVIDKFLWKPSISSDDLKEFNGIGVIGPDARTSLVVLRGLLAYNVLELALSKRWRVDFGVDASQSKSPGSFCRKMAVPFEAKDCAKPKTEFGHVDMAITLSVISYCRSGLSDSELDSVFDALMAHPEPDVLYQSIIGDGEGLDKAFQSLNSINRTDEQQKCTLYRALYKRLPVIDFFLVHIVFPREVKQFPFKLVATPWDLVPEAKARPLCGFSGTNDTELLLPPNVHQTDLPELKGTNARVLKAIMHERNNVVEKLTPEYGLREALQKHEKCKILLDVGALLLEDNTDFAIQWLKSRRDCKAVIMYQDNRLVVVSTSGTAVPLSRSPLSGDLGSCLVLLDEEHCRGTDLRLPQGSKAAITLGKGVTRDKFAQAAMRMRALISGDHTLIFLAASEVYNAISGKVSDSPRHEIADPAAMRPTNASVVRWALMNTRESLTQGISHWLCQGMFSATTNHYVLSARDENVKFQGTLQNDAVSLDAGYAVERREANMRQICKMEIATLPPEVRAGKWIEPIKKKCRGLFSKVPPRYRNALVDEEQERELEIEKEVEQRVERPPPFEPALPRVSRRLEAVLSEEVHLIDNALRTLRTCNSFLSEHITCANEGCGHTIGAMWSDHILCTGEFIWPIVRQHRMRLNEFLRPVHHVLYVDYQDKHSFVLISPFEAEYVANRTIMSRPSVPSATITMHQLTTKLRPGKAIDLWRYELALIVRHKGRAPEQQLFSNRLPLILKAQPLILKAQLHLFAGSTYFNLQDQMLICATLGICCAEHTVAEKLALDKGFIDAQDGFVDPEKRKFNISTFENVCKIRKSAVRNLREFLATSRRLGVRFEVSPLGRLLISATHSVSCQTNGGKDAEIHQLTLKNIESSRILTAKNPKEDPLLMARGAEEHLPVRRAKVPQQEYPILSANVLEDHQIRATKDAEGYPVLTTGRVKAHNSVTQQKWACSRQRLHFSVHARYAMDDKRGGVDADEEAAVQSPRQTGIIPGLPNAKSRKTVPTHSVPRANVDAVPSRATSRGLQKEENSWTVVSSRRQKVQKDVPANTPNSIPGLSTGISRTLSLQDGAQKTTRQKDDPGPRGTRSVDLPTRKKTDEHEWTEVGASSRHKGRPARHSFASDAMPVEWAEVGASSRHKGRPTRRSFASDAMPMPFQGNFYQPRSSPTFTRWNAASTQSLTCVEDQYRHKPRTLASDLTFKSVGKANKRKQKGKKKAHDAPSLHSDEPLTLESQPGQTLATKIDSKQSEWACCVCTYLNQSSLANCDMCEAPRQSTRP